MSSARLPLLARLLLRPLPRMQQERARADLLDVHARISNLRGEGAGRRACTGEAAKIVLWAGLDGLLRLSERLGAERGNVPMVRDLAQDVRFSVRSLARRPGFTFVTALVLGLGIGASAGIFTLADRLFLRTPSGVRAADELVSVFRSWGVPGVGGSVSYPDYVDYRTATRTLAGLAAFQPGYVASSETDSGLAPANLTAVSDNYFDVLGVVPETGRFFRPEENRTPGTHPVVVVSWRFSRERFGSGSDAVGSTVKLNGQPFEVVGVAPRNFTGLTPGQTAPDAWFPIMMRDAVAPSSDSAWRERLPNSRERWLRTIGRMNPGVDVRAVQTELAAEAARIRDAHGGDAAETVLVSPQFRWYPSTGSGLADLTRMLLVAVGLLLTIAAANVAILLVARASTRDRELGIRTAIGAGRSRIARQLLTESLLLGAAGCAFGLVLSVVAARVTSAVLPIELALPSLPDGRAILFAIAVSLVVSIIVGFAPVARVVRRDVAGLIHGRDAGAGGGRVRDGLVVLQIALSLVLVAGAALFARSLITASTLDLGFEDDGVLLVGVNLRNHGYDAERGRVFVRNALERISSLPGVSVATTTRMVPFRGDWTSEVSEWPGIDFASGRDTIVVGMNVVSPDYFAGMGIPLLAGRGIDASDVQGSQPVMVVNETFARAIFGDAHPVGMSVPLREGMPPFLIVGLARDATYYRLGETPHPQVYGALNQLWMPDVDFIVRTEGDPATLTRPVQRALLDLDPAIAFVSSETLASVRAEQLAGFRATASVVGMTGLMALILASAGLYGVMAWRVTQRTREIGVRMALGATRRRVASGILRGGLRLAFIGAVLGSIAAFALARLVQSLLFGVSARDPFSLLSAPIFLLFVAAVAVLVPARRAMRIDPMTAMRTD